jgi:hypothetical protein
LAETTISTRRLLARPSAEPLKTPWKQFQSAIPVYDLRRDPDE